MPILSYLIDRVYRRLDKNRKPPDLLSIDTHRGYYRLLIYSMPMIKVEFDLLQYIVEMNINPVDVLPQYIRASCTYLVPRLLLAETIVRLFDYVSFSKKTRDFIKKSNMLFGDLKFLGEKCNKSCTKLHNGDYRIAVYSSGNRIHLDVPKSLRGNNVEAYSSEIYEKLDAPSMDEH